MFGNILEIKGNYVLVENASKTLKNSILNYHVIFPENDRGVVGEVVSVNKDSIKIFLVGEISNNVFKPGVLRKPSFLSVPRIVYKKELELLIGNQDLSNKDTFYLGKSLVYKDFNITVKLNDFFSNHFAIIGNSGSGKSCGIARILQNIFQDNKGGIPENAHIVIFDVYGEYNSAFNNSEKIKNFGYKCFNTESNINYINIPAYLLDIDDLALLLNVTNSSQLPILEKTLKLVYIFNSLDPNIEEYKNDIIAECLLDILSSGRSSTQIIQRI